MIYSLRNKVALTFFILFMIPFLVIILLLSNEANKIIGSSIETTTFQTMDQSATYINTVADQAENVGKQVVNSKLFQDWTASQSNENQSQYDKYYLTQKLREYFYSLIQFNPTVISIEVYDNNGNITGLQSDYPKDSYLSTPWYIEAKESITWLKAHKDINLSANSQEMEVNSITIPIVNFKLVSKMGVLKVNFKTQLLKEPLEKIELGHNGHVFLLDAKGESILGQKITDNQNISKLDMQAIALNSKAEGQLKMEISKDNSIIFFRKLKVSNWLLIGQVPEKDLYAKVSQTKHSLLIISGILLLLIMLSAYWLSSGIARPLTKLAKAMRYAEKGEWKTAEDVISTKLTEKNEVGFVIMVFHTMIINLQNLIQRQYELIYQKKDAEYKALLLQINPHFLYNTLGMIGALSAQKKHEEVMDVTESLGQMLRYSLKLDSNLVYLSEEILNIQRYATIIRFYYGDAINLEILEESNMVGAQIIKFILQPLLENAVKYSQSNDKVAEVKLHVFTTEDQLRISISDNGVGMSPELIEELMLEQTESVILRNAGKEIGLRNVLTRCRLFYGDQFKLNIISSENKGTRITLILPDIKR